MDGARWERIQAIFHEALDRPAPERRAWIDAACGDDGDLRAEVLELIQEDASAGSVLDLDTAALAELVLSGDRDRRSVPTSVGRYTIIRPLGEGGMGIVYLASREDLGSRVAIKILRDAWVSPSRRERFAAEQRTLAQLTHPSIARIYDADTLPDATPWFAMEYVDGTPITDYCERQQLSIPDRLRLFRQVCEAVRHAHQRLIVHRDLKPSNIFVTTSGEVKLLDFGIAKPLEDLQASVEHTRSAVRLMTIAYAAPEQLRGEPTGVQTDVYALGVILFELLTGRRPFDLADRPAAEAEAVVLTELPPRPSSVAGTPASPQGVRPSAWADLDVLCLAALRKEPERRYASVEALMRDIDRFLSSKPLEAAPDSLAYRAGKFAQRHWRSLAAASVAVATLVGVVGFYTARLSAAHGEALSEAARTRRIQRFMLNLFEAGEGRVAPSNDLTVVSLLDKGVQEARGLQADPAVQAELYYTVGTLFHRLGRLDQADEMLQASLERRRGLFKPGDPELVSTLIALSQLRVAQARLDEAQAFVREGLDNARQALPDGHPAIVAATAELGRVLREKGEYDGASPFLEEAIRAYEGSPAEAQNLADALTALGEAHYYAGRSEEADRLLQRALALDRQLHGDRHPSVAHGLLSLGAIRTRWGKYDEAERCYRDALSIMEAWYGPDHPETASAMTILGQDLSRARPEEGAQLLRRALAVQEKVYGQLHPRVALALNALGMVAMRIERFDEAEAAFSRAADVYRSVYGTNYRVAIALSNLASVHHARGQYGRAEALFIQALAVYAETLPPDHPDPAIARIKLGRTLNRDNRPREAEPHLLTAYGALTAQANPAATWVRTAREELVIAYTALNRPDDAARYRAELGGGPGR